MDIDFSKYSCKKKNMQYTIIGESIKKDFDFIKSNGAIAQKLDEMVNHLKNAAAITDGFYFENGGNVNDVNEAYEEIKTDVLAVEIYADAECDNSKEWNINGEKVALGVVKQ